MKRRYLILTAGYGEGHNSAARALGEACSLRGAEYQMHDLCRESFPRAFVESRNAYLKMISHWPWLWRIFYDLTDRADLRSFSALGMFRMRNALEQILQEYAPQAVFCTFPLYAVLIDGIRKRQGVYAPPCLLVVTDSWEINRAWFCSEPDMWLVADSWTRRRLLDVYGIEEKRIQTTGFPVSTELSASAVDAWSEGGPFRILYVPHGSPRYVERELEVLLNVHPKITVSLVTGSRSRVYASWGEKWRSRAGGRLSMFGWVADMPRMMREHHLYIGKAGGASVHEAYAACLPMLINAFVPGQEEGNVHLLEQEGCGAFCEDLVELSRLLMCLLKADGRRWRKMKCKMTALSRRGGAARCLDWAESLLR